MATSNGPMLTASGMAAAVRELTGGRVRPTRIAIWNWCRHGTKVGDIWVKLNTVQVGHMFTATRDDVRAFLLATGKLKLVEKQIEQLSA